MSVSPACVYVNHIPAWNLLRSEEGIRALGTGVIEGCELWVLGIEPGAAARTSTLKTPSQLSSSNFMRIFLRRGNYNCNLWYERGRNVIIVDL